MTLPARMLQCLLTISAPILVVVLVWWMAITTGRLPTEIAVAVTCLAGVSLFFAGQEVGVFARWLAVWECKRDPQRIADHVAALDSSEIHAVRKSLQVLADLWGHPLGAVTCWPIEEMGEGQVRLVARFYAGLARTRIPQAGGKTLMELAHPPGDQLTDALATQSASLEKLVSDYAESAAEAMKQAMLDLELPGDDETSKVPRPLPPLDREPFLQQARPHVDDVLHQLADVMTEEGRSNEIEAHADEVYEVFGQLGLVMLQLGQQLRLEAAATGTAPRVDTQPGRVRCKRFSDIRLPHLPGAQGGWVEKYRKMRAGEPTTESEWE